MHEADKSAFSLDHTKKARKYIKKCDAKLKKLMGKGYRPSERREGVSVQDLIYPEEYDWDGGGADNTIWVPSESELLAEQEEHQAREMGMVDEAVEGVSIPEKGSVEYGVKKARARQDKKKKWRETFAGQTKDIFVRGARYYREGDYDKAAAQFEKVLKMDPDNRKAAAYIEKCSKASVARVSAKEEAQRRIAEEMLEKDGQRKAVTGGPVAGDDLGDSQASDASEQTEIIKWFLRKAGEQLQAGDLDGARNYADKALGIAPDNAAARAILKKTEQAEKMSSAERQYRKAIQQ